MIEEQDLAGRGLTPLYLAALVAQDPITGTLCEMLGQILQRLHLTRQNQILILLGRRIDSDDQRESQPARRHLDFLRLNLKLTLGHINYLLASHCLAPVLCDDINIRLREYLPIVCNVQPHAQR